jgi:hypothetical protein
MNIYTKLIAGLVLLILVTNISSAAIVEETTGALPTQLQEGKQADFTIKIKNYEDTKQLVLETSLIPLTADKPLWNFGDAESVINASRYQQKITLDISSLPAVLTVSVSGKAPEGIIIVKCDDDTVLNKMQDTKLKFFEVRADEKLIKIEPFELIINIRETFENTIKQIKRSEFDAMKTDVSKVFYSGLTTEAQRIALEMSKINWPGSLKLFGVVTIESNMYLNIIVAILMILCLVIGYVLGSKGKEDED